MAFVELMLVFLYAGFCRCSFPSSSTKNGLTSNEFHVLSRGLIEEEKSRKHLENHVTTLEQKLLRLEQELLEANQTVSDVDAKCVTHNASLELNNIKSLVLKLEQELNTTKTELKQQSIINLSLKLEAESERASSRKLQQDYIELFLDLQNLTHVHNSLMIQNDKHDTDIGNLTAYLRSLSGDLQAVNKSTVDEFDNVYVKLNELYQVVNSTQAASKPHSYDFNASLEITDQIKDMKLNLTLLSQNLAYAYVVYRAINSSVFANKIAIASLLSDFPTYQKNISTNQASIASNAIKISSLEAIITSLLAKVSSFDAMQQKSGYQSAFTVTGSPSNKSAPGSVIFSDVKSNIGNHYNASTGQFTCRYSGVYLFSLDLYKEASARSAYCYIRHNGADTVIAEPYPGDSSPGGYQAAGTSVVLHLKAGDVVDIGGCTAGSSINEESSFTGSLLIPD